MICQIKWGGGVRCCLANFDQPVDVKGKFHCIIGTTKSIETHLFEELNISVRMVLFDDCNKSMSFNTELMKFGAKYVCVTSYSSKTLKETCKQQLQAKQFSLPMREIISANLRHIEFCCSSIDEKLYVTTQLCNWENAKNIVIFVLVTTYFMGFLYKYLRFLQKISQTKFEIHFNHFSFDLFL